jgi:Trehalase
MEPMAAAWVETPEVAIDRTFAHIAGCWADLTRPGDWLAFPLPHAYVRPGGFFKMFVYWDSYFILLGLVVQGQWELAAGVVDNLVHAVERIGHVPGYISSKTVCRSRSQSPYLTAAILEVLPYRDDPAWLARAAAAAEREYREYWTAEPHLHDTGLSRYVDPGGNGCVTVPDTPHYRALAESGWDNSPRFGDDATAVVPVDLNAQLYRYERDLARFCELLERPKEAAAWLARALERRTLIDRHRGLRKRAATGTSTCAPAGPSPGRRTPCRPSCRFGPGSPTTRRLPGWWNTCGCSSTSTAWPPASRAGTTTPSTTTRPAGRTRTGTWPRGCSGTATARRPVASP